MTRFGQNIYIIFHMRIWETSRRLSETSRKPLGDLLETSRRPLGDLSETSRRPLGNLSEPLGDLSGTSRRPLGDVPRGFQEVSERFPRCLREVPRGFQEVSERFPRGLREVPRGFQEASERFPRGLREVPRGFQEVSERFPRGLREVSERFLRGLREVSERFPRGLVIGMSSLPACCPSTLPRFFQSGKHAGGLTKRFAGNFAKDVKPQTIGRRYAPSGFANGFSHNLSSKNRVFDHKSKNQCSYYTATPLSTINYYIYIYIIYIYIYINVPATSLATANWRPRNMDSSVTLLVQWLGCLCLQQLFHIVRMNSCSAGIG